LLNTYVKKVILFPAGASGHFLASFLCANPNVIPPAFRLDMNQDFGGVSKFCKTYDDIVSELDNSTTRIIVSHFQEVTKLRSHKNAPQLYKIYPKTNVFGWIKNVFAKKQLLETVDYSGADFVMQIDIHFMHIHDFYTQLKLDQDLPDDVVIDFGQLYDIEYLTELYTVVNRHPPAQETLDFARQYIDKQFPPMDDCVSLDLQEIISHVNPQDNFDLATLIFIYEKNHNTVDRNRLWSIDDLPTTIEGSIEFLLKNEKNYTIFRNTVR
jgi:hypothetical protein